MAGAVDPETHVIFGPKMSHLLQTRIFWENHLQNFDVPLGPFHCATNKNILTAGAEKYTPNMNIFGKSIKHFPKA